MAKLFEDGCMWKIAEHKTRKDQWTEFCGKARQSGSMYCPKHVVIALDATRELERAADRRAEKRAAKQAKEAALEASPLRANNPAAVKPTNYTEPSK
jgi:hypothetical protein